ncbi:MAG: CoA-binding protein, partial [Akkermansiaceae bacterium]|nr:CoA-binding protein [Akkermansiaceae bacterium]
KDSTSLLLPVDRERVAGAIEGLRCAPLLHGFRGRPPADLDAAVDAIMALDALVERDPAFIVELDVNPLMVLAAGHG